MSKVEEQAERLMAFLLKNKVDRGVMADLRCGFSDARQHRAFFARVALYDEEVVPKAIEVVSGIVAAV
ncbi:MAG: hypothetical protein JXR40_00005, partial [Pontiellaceae bacterium]|nr:hypothetical protein [Pontiellaceae bacterium]